MVPRRLAQVEDIAAGARRIYLRPEHGNTITDMVCIAEKELVVTSSLDRRVCVWQARKKAGGDCIEEYDNNVIRHNHVLRPRGRPACSRSAGNNAFGVRRFPAKSETRVVPFRVSLL